MASSMTSLLYLETDVICLLILSMVKVSLMRRTVKMPDDRLFHVVIDGILLLLLSDAVWAMIDGKLFWGARLLNYLASGMYLFATAAVTLSWLVYVLYRRSENMRAIKKWWLPLALPAVLLLLLCIASLWTGWIFSVTPENIYQRGPLHWVQIAVGTLYLAVACYYTFRAALKADSPADRQEFRLFCALILMVILGGVGQTLVFEIPVTMVAVTVAIMAVFIKVQHKRSSEDSLTQISARSRMQRYINARIQTETLNGKLYLVLLDLDEFGLYNSTFGRFAGDMLLKSTALVLLEACRPHTCLVARYGGDEFAIVCEFQDEFEIVRLTEEIEQRLLQLSERERLPDPVRFTASYAVYEPGETADADALCSAAELALAERKQQKAAVEIPA